MVDGRVEVEVTAVGHGTLVGAMATELEAALDRPATERSHPLAGLFTGATLLAAAATAVWWSASGEALEHTVAVLVVACPCALALARPLCGAAASGAAARRGVLFANPSALRRAATVDTVLLDKTGTLTGGRLEVTRGSDRAVRIAAGLERHSRHPVARAVVAAAIERGIPLPVATEVREQPGLGIEGVVDGERWSVRAGDPGTVRLVGPWSESITLRDRVRAEAAAAVARLTALGLAVRIASGDHPQVVEARAAEVGVEAARGGMSPADKRAEVGRLQARGHRVLFAGDGANDALALVGADVGLAMRDGSATALDAADGVLGEGGLDALVAAVHAARAGERAVRIATVVSLVYNVVAVAAAAAGAVDPLVAAWSLLVVARALRVEPTVTRRLAAR